MRILTCNIRCFGGDDGENGWPHRRDLCAAVIRSRAPDIICFQELWAEQFRDLRPAFPEYAWFGMADEPHTRRPMNAVFYRRNAFTRVSAGGYWLSETPHVSGSKSWDSDCVRMANWLRLEERDRDGGSGQEFRVVNTHLDHVSQLAREHQARMIVEDARAYPTEYPQVLTGDMNCSAGNRAISIFKAGGWRDTYAAVHPTENPGNTYHGFLGPAFQADVGKIDWVFVRGSVEVLDAEIVRDSRDGRFPSDHYFVGADVCLEDAQT